jgi:glycerophosphoryl diester phosphodiesterase
MQAARAAGADLIECDVHAYRGRLEVRHLKTAGPLPVLWDRWELAPASTPRLGLEQLLAAAVSGPPLMLDLKGRHESTGRAVAEVLRAWSPQREIYVCGRYWPSVERAAAQEDVRAVLSARNPLELALLCRRLDAPDRRPPDGVSMHVSLLRRQLVDWLLSKVPAVMTWPVDDRECLDHVLKIGANGIITNQDDVLRAVRDLRGPSDVRASSPAGRP